MFTNRLTNYDRQPSIQQKTMLRTQAFTPCPQMLFPGDWAIGIYAIAYAQAQEAVAQQRSGYLRQECWN